MSWDSLHLSSLTPYPFQHTRYLTFPWNSQLLKSFLTSYSSTPSQSAGCTTKVDGVLKALVPVGAGTVAPRVGASWAGCLARIVSQVVSLTAGVEEEALG